MAAGRWSPGSRRGSLFSRSRLTCGEPTRTVCSLHWAGKEGDRSRNGLNHQPPAALPSDSQSGRPRCASHLGNATNVPTRPAHLYCEGLSRASLCASPNPVPSSCRRFLIYNRYCRTRFLHLRRHLYRQRCHQKFVRR